MVERKWNKRWRVIDHGVRIPLDNKDELWP
jgi:hypothetical protein